ncbi:ATP-binding protein [Streptomyces sp. NPDC041003]|uniref:ATP-binding protein n=1 Tax=Streptomyces sp. NPDC041003 TaxID=3155730 RepID=UPI0033D3ED50
MTALLNQQFLTALAFGQGIERASVQIESEAGTVSDARRFVRGQLAIWMFPEADDFSDRVVLAASELVTNAVLHARTRPPGESELIAVTLAFKPGIALGVLVCDNSDQVPMVNIRPPVNAINGRGLALVNSLADGWTAAPRESREGGSGKGVWAFFRCPQTVGLLPRSA